MNWDTALSEATHKLAGSANDIYKYGVHGLIFRYDGFDWTRTTVESKQLTPLTGLNYSRLGKMQVRSALL